MRVWIPPVDVGNSAIAADSGLADVLPWRLSTALFTQTDRPVDVVDRRITASLLSEQELSAQLSAPEDTVRLGGFLGARVAVLCQANTVFGEQALSVSLVDVETSRRIPAGEFPLNRATALAPLVEEIGRTVVTALDKAYPAVSAITTFTTPYLIKASPDVATWLSRVLPKSWVDGLERYSAQTGQVKVTSDWKVLMRAYALNIVVFAVLSLAVIILGYSFLPRVFGEGIGWFDGELIAGFVTMILVVPFIWAMSFPRIKREAYQHLWLNRKQLRGPLVIVELARVLIAVLMLSILVNQFFSTGWALILSITIFSIAIVVFRRKLLHFYGRVEQPPRGRWSPAAGTSRGSSSCAEA